MMPQPRYHAYLSYARQDNREEGRHWASWLHQALETFEVPAALVGKRTPVGPVPASLFPVYCNAREPAEGGLDAASKQALDESRALIVICSPRAAVSRQVAEEVRYFKQLGRERIFALIVAGDPEASEGSQVCFPDTLRHDVRKDGTVDREWRVHPAGADVRFERNSEGYTTAAALREVLEGEGISGKKLADPTTAYAEKLEAGRRKIIAGVLGVPVPELLPDGPATGARKPARGLQYFLVGTTVIFAAAAGVAGWYAWSAQEKVLDSDGEEQKSELLIRWLHNDLRSKHSSPRDLQLIAEANERLSDHFSLKAMKSTEPMVLSAQADALGTGAEIASARADYPAALQLATRAIEIRQRALNEQGGASQADATLVSDIRRLAKALMKVEKKTEALKQAEKAHTLSAQLASRDAGDAEVLQQAIGAAYEHGDMLAATTPSTEAQKAYMDGYVLAGKLVKLDEINPRFEQLLAQGELHLARHLHRNGSYEEALSRFQAWEKIMTPLTQAQPGDLVLLREFATGKNWLGGALALERKFTEAAKQQRIALELWERLAKADPGNADIQAEYSAALRRLAEGLLASGPENKIDALTLIQTGLDHVARVFPDKNDLRATTLRTELERVKAQAMQ